VSGVARNYVSQYDGDGGLSGNYFPNGLRANAGGGENRNAELWAVSANSNASDNRAGGKSEVDGRTGRWPFILDDFTGSDTGTATELPTFDNSEHGFATNGIVYGLSADGRYAVGMDYTLGLERAVLWDLDLMVELDLTQYAIDQGIIGDFGGNLRRAYAVGVNDSGEPVVTGWGFDDVEVAVRGFVLTVHDITGSLPCGLPFADDDRDGDVDQDDYGRFQACHTGQGPVTLDPGCACFDRDSDGAGDGDVDQDDWGAFEACASGPDVPVDPTCDDPAP
jgi:hypothetical protein